MRIIPVMLVALMASGCTHFALAAQLLQKMDRNAKERERLLQEQKVIENNIGLLGGDKQVAQASPAPSPEPR